MTKSDRSPRGADLTAPDSPAPVEAPVWLELNGRPAHAWLCTPSRLEALACGWLKGEGIITRRGEISALEVCADELRVTARTAANVPPAPRTLSTGPGTSAFSLDRIPEEPPRAVPKIQTLIVSGGLRSAFQEMFRRCALRAGGGGVHSGALLAAGEVRHVAEDVGRHNVMDKVVGAALLAPTPLEGSLVLLSGRISAEIAVKAWRAGVGGVATLSVPTSLAREIARRCGVWIVGRSQRESPIVYEPGGECAR